MIEEQDMYYKALRTHDRRFDGRFFTGVKTTGIYCRPVCRARTPKAQNCVFFKTAAAAEQAGFRPCLKCQPELAPGIASTDSENRLGQAAARLIDSGFLQDASIAALAAELDITDRHLRRVFQVYAGVSPVAYAQTHKLLLAKQLLTETSLPVTIVAYSSGFESLSRFNSLFKAHYRLSPRQLRKSRVIYEHTLCLTISYRPPFAWNSLLDFLSGRAIKGVEIIENNTYKRTISIVRAGKTYQGWIEVSHKPASSRLLVRMPLDLAPVAGIILVKVKHLFDTDCQPDVVAAHLGELAAGEPGLRVPGAFDGFEVAVRAILGQQISVKAATVIAGRLAATFGKTIDTPYRDLVTIFPAAVVLAKVPSQKMIDCGLYSQRALAVQQLARACAEGLALNPRSEVESTMTRLKTLPGIGEWMAQYIAMRALAWPDVFLHTDLAVKKALHETNPKKIIEKSAAWQPWRAYATMYLWRKAYLESGQ